jgi:hypothetical protein
VRASSKVADSACTRSTSRERLERANVATALKIDAAVTLRSRVVAVELLPQGILIGNVGEKGSVWACDVELAHAHRVELSLVRNPLPVGAPVVGDRTAPPLDDVAVGRSELRVEAPECFVALRSFGVGEPEHLPWPRKRYAGSPHAEWKVFLD